MINYSSNNNWEEMGIAWLTGEADALSMRILCDVSYEGQCLIKEFLRVPVLELHDRVNSRVGKYEAMGSILLPWQVKEPLWIFYFRAYKNYWVIEFGGRKSGFIHDYAAMDDEEWKSEEVQKHFGFDGYAGTICRYPPANGKLNNVHQFTGREY